MGRLPAVGVVGLVVGLVPVYESARMPMRVMVLVLVLVMVMALMSMPVLVAVLMLLLTLVLVLVLVRAGHADSDRDLPTAGFPPPLGPCKGVAVPVRIRPGYLLVVGRVLR
jgi:Ca2+/Na+ antiporter